MIRDISILVALQLCLATGALASSSDIVETEGGTVRLVTSGLAGPDGRLRGALEIGLNPGWKTYWRDPGSAGVPPEVDIAQSINIASAEIHFPAPQWHDDGYGAWAGYDKSLALPVTFTVSDPDRYSVIEADVFLGICQTICVPVRARLSVEPGNDPNNRGDEVVVAAAHAAIPPQATPEFGVLSVDLKGDHLMITTAAPDGAEDPSLFLAGVKGYGFGQPQLASRSEGKARFTVPMAAVTREPSTPATIHYTMSSSGRSVAGTFDIP